MLVDRNARHRNLPVVLQPEIFFGQLQCIIVMDIGPSQKLGLQEPETIILAAIRTCADAKTLPDGTSIITPEKAVWRLLMSTVFNVVLGASRMVTSGPLLIEVRNTLLPCLQMMYKTLKY
jgi:hypothetical protein